ncbi:hypothetical protein ACI2KR_08895 [Pseudomonas luteola]
MKSLSCALVLVVLSQGAYASEILNKDKEYLEYLKAIKNDECLAKADHVSEVLASMEEISASYIEAGGPLDNIPYFAQNGQSLARTPEKAKLLFIIEAYSQCAGRNSGHKISPRS